MTDIEHKWVGGELWVRTTDGWRTWSGIHELSVCGDGTNDDPHAIAVYGGDEAICDGDDPAALLDHVAGLYEERAKRQEDRWVDYLGTDPLDHTLATVLGSIAAALMPFHERVGVSAPLDIAEELRKAGLGE